MKKLKPGWREIGIFWLAFLLGWGLSVGWKAVQEYWLFQQKQQKNQQLITLLRETAYQQSIYKVALGRGNFTDDPTALGLKWEDNILCGNVLFCPASQIANERKNCFERLNHHFDFQFTIEPAAPPTKEAAYRVIVRPKKNDQTGYALNDCYYLDQTGIIRHSGSAEITPDQTSQPINPNEY